MVVGEIVDLPRLVWVWSVCANFLWSVHVATRQPRFLVQSITAEQEVHKQRVLMTY